MADAIIWLFVIEVLGLLAVPVAASFFGFLPEKGYSFSKIIGLLVAGFAVWFLGMLGLPFTAVTAWLISVVVLGGLNGWLLFGNGRKLLTELGAFFRERGALILGIEILLVVSFLFLVFVRSYSPEIRGTEKPGDFAFMNSMVISDKLPPEDPWMSGYFINYYYFSHFMMAMITKMSGIEPHFAYNYTVQIVFALTAVAAFGIVYNLIGLVRKKIGGIAVLGGLLASFFICVSGNLDAVRQILTRKSDGTFYFDTWSPSRVVKDYMPVPVGNGYVEYRYLETINEFPYFSFILSDMHPHVMALPFVLLAIMTAFKWLIAPVGSNIYSLRRADGIFSFLMTALILGSLYFFNTWDFPTFLILVGGAVLVREIRLGAQETLADVTKGATLRAMLLGGEVYNTFWRRTARWIGFSVRMVIVSLALYLPFHLTFVSLVGNAYLPEGLDDIPVVSQLAKLILVVAWDRTPLLSYLMVFGVFALPIVTFLAIKLFPYLKSPYAYLDEEDVREYRPSGYGVFVFGAGLIMIAFSLVLYAIGMPTGLTLTLGILSSPVVGVGMFLVARDFLGKIRSLRMVGELRLALLLVMVLLVTIGWYARFELYGVLIPCFVFAGLLLWFENRKVGREESFAHADNVVLMLIFLPALICFVIEIIFLRDIFAYRINTLFKFYYQAWVMYGLAAAYCSWRVLAYAWQTREVSGDELQVTNEAKAVAEQYTGKRGQEVEGLANRQASQEEDSPLAPRQPVLSAATSRRPALVLELDSPPVSRPPSLEYGASHAPRHSSVVLDQEKVWELEETGRQAARKVRWWRWLWTFGLILVLLCALVYPIFATYEKTGRFGQAVGLDGMVHIQRDYPTIYPAIQWMREQEKQDPNFKGVLVEAQGGDWADWSVFSSFTGFPSVMGWSGHEQQWRGGKQSILNEVGERVSAVEEIYSTTDVNRTKQLLEKYKVRYVIVGPFETGEKSGGYLFGQPPKNYPREALAKFASFMKVIYSQDGVTIYEKV
jgi:YYY domain-containing protein